MADRADEPRPSPWVGLDARGGSGAIDPTKNVLDLVEAERKRQDDLRSAFEKFVQSQMHSLEVMENLRSEHSQAMKDAESRRVNEQLSLRAGYDERLAQAEAKRIDAIRAVDVNAVSVASQRASDQASVLATQVVQSAEQLRTQVAQSAETLRSLVASTASTASANLQQLVTGLSTRITTLEQAQYEGKGKQSFADPAFAELLSEVKSLRAATSTSTGKNEGIGMSWAVFLGAATLGLAILGSVLLFNRSPATAPQVIYVPAPAVATPVPK